MNWFERHLNWSLFFGTFLLPFGVGLIFTAIFVAVFWGQLAPSMGSGMDGLSEEVFTSTFLQSLPLIIIAGLVNIALSVFAFIVAWWYLGQKARTKWFLLLMILPGVLSGIFRGTGSSSIIMSLLILLVALVCAIIFYRLENQAIGYGGDFGDYLTREPVTDQRADTRQYGTPDDWRPKELDYSPAKDARYIAYGGDVKDVRDVGVPSGEVPAKPPAEVQEKAVENVPADAQEKAASEAPAEAIEQLPVEAMQKIPEETTPEAMGGLPVEAPAAAAEVREEAPEKVLEEAIGQSLTEAIEEVLEEPPAETTAAAQVIETTSSQPLSQVPILLDDAGAVLKCFYHPDTDSVNLCSRCGHYVCSECNYVTGTHPICRNCWDRRGEVPISAAFVKKQEGPKLAKSEKPGKSPVSAAPAVPAVPAIPAIPDVTVQKQETPKLAKSDKRKMEDGERSRQFLMLYEQALPFISAVVTKGPDGLPASPLDLMEGLKLSPMLKHAKKLPKPREKELQEAKKIFEQLLAACVKVGETAADFVSSSGQVIPTEADYARLADGIEKSSALMGGLYQRMVSLSQPQE